MNTIICFLIAVLAVVVGVLLWISESSQDRAIRWRRQGWSQQRIADRLGVTRYRVRVWTA
jgi:hypothetical protein